MPESLTVLVAGTPADGFTFYGPVTPNDPALEAFTENELHDTYWWYCQLQPLPGTSPILETIETFVAAMESADLAAFPTDEQDDIKRAYHLLEAVANEAALREASNA
jgi:hypothetical protein